MRPLLMPGQKAPSFVVSKTPPGAGAKISPIELNVTASGIERAIGRYGHSKERGHLARFP
jgi:hypothetical protein